MGLLDTELAKWKRAFGLISGIPKTLKNNPANAATADAMFGLLGGVPGLGDYVSGAEAKYRYDQGDMLGAGLAGLGALPAIPNMAGLAHGLGALPLAHTVYHGSPHKFNKFDMSKIGTGEGAQAYGHGLYFAEAPEVAKGYQQGLSSKSLFVDGKPVSLLKKGQNYSEFSSAVKKLGFKDKEAKDASYLINQYFANGGDDWGKVRSEIGDYADFFKQPMLDLLDKIEPRVTSKFNGQLYKVDIPDEAIPRMLDWDKPLSEQSQHVLDALAKSKNKQVRAMLEYAQTPYSADIGGEAKTMGEAFKLLNLNLHGRSAADSAKASALLAKQGIPGIRYLDGGSRNAGDGTSNFVLFDDQMPRILEVNGQPTGLLSYADEAKKAKSSGLDYQIEHKPMSVEGGAATLDDLTKSFGEDVYGKNAAQYFGSEPLEIETLKIMQKLRGKPDELVTIYRGVPKDVKSINKGDWVTLNKTVAKMYADPNVYGEAKKGKGKVIEMKVPAKHITSWPDSLLEFGYFPTDEVKTGLLK